MHVNIFAIICLEFWQISTHGLGSSNSKLIYLSGICLPYRNKILFENVWLKAHCDSFFFPWVSFSSHPISLLVA